MKLQRALATARQSEAGAAIMEVVVSAAVLALVAVAVLAGIDGASGSTGREKARSVAASLAEQDQERMRSMQADSLADFSESRPVDVDGAQYTVESSGRWITDESGGTPSCGNNSESADYLQISSRVTSNVVGTRVQPVEIKSLVAPSVVYSSTHGHLAVQVNNRDNVGVQGISVTVTGPASPPAAITNDQGCVVFPYLPEGNYNVTLNRVGWVDQFGNQTSVGNQDVSAGTVNQLTMKYDQAATIVTSPYVRTYRPGASSLGTATVVASTARRISATNNDQSGLRRVYSSVGDLMVPTITADGLFPFSSAYAVFTGSCAESNPVSHVLNYFSTLPGSGASVATNPAATHTATVYQPPINIRVRNRFNQLANNITVVATLDADSDCASSERRYVMTTTIRPDTGELGWVSNGAVYDPGLPFGEYDFCFQDGSRRKFQNDYLNNRALGRSSMIEVSSSNWNSGTC